METCPQKKYTKKFQFYILVSITFYTYIPNMTDGDEIILYYVLLFLSTNLPEPTGESTTGSSGDDLSRVASRWGRMEEARREYMFAGRRIMPSGRIGATRRGRRKYCQEARDAALKLEEGTHGRRREYNLQAKVDECLQTIHIPVEHGVVYPSLKFSTLDYTLRTLLQCTVLYG